MEKEVKVGICVSYDWHLLKRSLPIIYPHATKLCLSIDKNRLTWSGEQYAFDESAFRNFIQTIDVAKKIDIYEDSFYDASRSSIANDNLQRTLMSRRLGSGGWHVQVDSDEYFLDFKGFLEYLWRYENSLFRSTKPVNVCCQWISIFKKVEDGYLLVDNSSSVWESMPFATNKPEYLNARRNSHFNIESPFFVVHETWSRSVDELKQKLNAWGHNNDFLDKEAYLNFWRSVDNSNYQFAHNFHPIYPETWRRLCYVKADSIEELLLKVKDDEKFTIPSRNLWLRNSRNWNRLLATLKKIR